MKVLNPLLISDAALVASSVPEDDHPEWAAAAVYDLNDEVISTATHRVYRSVQAGNLANDPTNDDGTWWTDAGATSRWRVFDQKVGSTAAQAGAISYTLAPPSVVTGVALFSLNAPEVSVTVRDATAQTVFDRTVSLVDDTEIIDFLTFFTTDLAQAVHSKFLLDDLLALPGYEVTVTIGNGAGEVSIGEIALGRITRLGRTSPGTSLGLTSFSTKEQDDFGDLYIVPRAKSDPMEFQFTAPVGDLGRVKRFLDGLRDTPAVYIADGPLADHDAFTFGFFQSYDIPLEVAGVSNIVLEIEGLT